MRKKKSHSLALVVAFVIIVLSVSFLKQRSMVQYALQNTTVTTQQQVRDKEDRICIFHVGPPKTGTSSIQNLLYNNEEMRDALTEDNYRVPISNPSNAIPHYFRHDNGERRSSTLDFFQSSIGRSANRNKNIIFSSEYFSFKALDITELMSDVIPLYKVHIVLYYRRLYDWLLSYHNQKVKDVEKNRKTFVEWLSNENFEFYYQRNSPRRAYERYTNHPDIYNVSVVNMHEDPVNFNSQERFFCDHVDHAPHACELAKSTKVIKSNGSEDINWILFKHRVPIYHSIRLSESDTKWNQVSAKFKNLTDVPKVCLSSEIREKLLELSLESEILLTPESWHNSKEGLEYLKSDFEQKINSSFCSMDIEAILTTDEWQTFLTELERK